MKGSAECLFVGGPGGDEVLTMPAVQCRDRLSVEQDGWLQARADGGVNVMRGPRPRNANWESYNRAVYEKDKSAPAGRVTYRFQHVEVVNRCAQILPLKDRRCMHEALEGKKYCRQHQKN
jgi:hypothetical protein